VDIICLYSFSSLPSFLWSRLGGQPAFFLHSVSFFSGRGPSILVGLLLDSFHHHADSPDMRGLDSAAVDRDGRNKSKKAPDESGTGGEHRDLHADRRGGQLLRVFLLLPSARGRNLAGPATEGSPP